MTDHEETNNGVVELDIKGQFAKLLVTTAAAFIASKAAESIFNKVVQARRDQAAEPQQ